MKKMMFLALLLSAVMFTFGQLQTPQPSPSSKVSQTVGLTNISIDYSRPGVKGRTIFGDLVPYGKLWRTGANGSTDITFDKDVMIDGKELKAGSYALYTVPNKKNWDVIFHSNTEYWGAGGDQYDAAGEVLKVKVAPKKARDFVETFTIDINSLTNNGAELTLSWADVTVGVPISVHTKKQVSASIKQVLSGPSANDYYAAGRFYYDEELELPKALEWVTKATNARPEAFWMMRTKSQILAKMGNYAEAIAAAKLSKAAAETAGNKQYVKFNNEAIAEWSKM